MFDPTTYRPDRLVVEGSNWMRNTLGLKPYQFSNARVGEHLHMLDCRFDMVTLAAVVEPHSSGYPKVTKTSRCHICQPPKPALLPPAPAVPKAGGFDPTAYRNITSRDREFNITVVATAMRAATNAEMWALWEGFRNALGWTAASEMWRFAAWRRSAVTVTTDSCADVARTLRVLAPYATKAVA